MNKKRKFTEEEDRVILSKIAENPSNLARTFRQIADETGRHPKSIANRWYNHLAKKDRNHKTNAKFTTYCTTAMQINRKISRADTQQPVKVKRSKWRRILDILFE